MRTKRQKKNASANLRVRHGVVGRGSHTDLMKNNSYDKKMFRVFYVLNRLSNGEPVTAVGLASEFGVTVRTVQRDLELLLTTGFPLRFDGRAYSFEEGFSLRKISVTPEEKFLLMLFYKLFSQTEKPLNSTAKNLLNKVIATSEDKSKRSSERSIEAKRKILKEEFTNFSDLLASRLEDSEYPRTLIDKVDACSAEMKEKVRTLSIRDKVAIIIQTTGQYENDKPIASIRVPKAYFKDKTAKFDFSPKERNREFTVITHLPSKFHKKFRVSLRLDMFFSFWGTHFKVKQITCFDNFAAYLGFPRNLKRFNYDASYGARNNKHQVLLTRAALIWEKEIPLSREEMKPFLNKKSGTLWSKSWDEKKKKWKIKR